MKIYLACFLLIVFFGNCKEQTKGNAINQPLQEIQKSYIDGNIPDSANFNKFLGRDLNKYFSVKYGDIKTARAFLREGPTQSGSAYPKYYFWVKIYKRDKLANEGAVRVEAIDKKEFIVTYFVSATEIKNNTRDISAVFPLAVCETIKSRFL